MYAADGATFRVVFVESAVEVELRQLLRALTLEIVAGPSAVGTYTLRRSAPSGAAISPTDALEALRESPLVRLAEPVGGFTDL